MERIELVTFWYKNHALPTRSHLSRQLKSLLILVLDAYFFVYTYLFHVTSAGSRHLRLTSSGLKWKMIELFR
nr:hypothetical protein Iba_chr06aCG20270 [Ipomoea batatas]